LGDVLVLSSPSRLRSERDKAGPVSIGVQAYLLNRLDSVASTESEMHKHKVALLMDEMMIKGMKSITDILGNRNELKTDVLKHHQYLTASSTKASYSIISR